MFNKRTAAALALGAALAMTMPAFAGETVGPDGEKATPTSDLKLTDAEVAKLDLGERLDYARKMTEQTKRRTP